MAPIHLFLYILASLASPGRPNKTSWNNNVETPPIRDDSVPDVSIAGTSVALYLQTLSQRELGVAQLQTLFNRRGTRSENRDAPEEDAFRLSSMLHHKTNQLYNHLARIANILSTSGMPVVDEPCCPTKLTTVSSTNVVQACTVNHKADSASVTMSAFENIESMIGVSSQYYLSSQGHVEFPAARLCGQEADLRHRQVFAGTLHPEAKNVVVMVDRGPTLNSRQLDMGRAVARYVVASLTSQDHVALVTLEGSVTVPSVDGCSLKKMVAASDSAKSSLLGHLNAVHRDEYRLSDHCGGFNMTRRIIKNSDLTRGQTVHLYYITAVRMGGSQRLKDVFQAVASLRNQLYELNIIIHVFYMDKGHDDDVAAFMSLTKQDFWQAYNISKDPRLEISSGRFVAVDSTYMLSSTIGDIFPTTTVGLQHKAYRMFMPHSSTSEQGLVLSLGLTVALPKEVGVVGLDAHYEYFFEDSLLFAQSDDYYACVLDKETGNVISHPRLDHTAEQRNLGLEQFELPLLPEVDLDTFKQHLKVVVNEAVGNLSVSADRVYYWHAVPETSFVVLVVATTPKEETYSSQQQKHDMKSANIFFHRLDLLPAQSQRKLCRHLHLPATLESGAVYLNAAAFAEPFRNVNLDADKVTQYMSYLTDINATTNPGFQTGVKDDLLLVFQMTSIWRNMSYDSGLNNYIVRRFAATKSGLFYAYPGSPVQTGFQAQKQEWYLDAVKFPGRVVVSGPQLDPGGAGYIVTLSQAIAAADDNGGNVLAVIGMDITLGYVYKMLLNTMPDCASAAGNVRCFLFDDEGFLVAHPTILDPRQKHKVEGQHLTHLEPFVARRIIDDAKMSTKHMCKQVSEMAVKHYYEFNTTAGATHAMADDCAKFQVSYVQGTNVFIGAVVTVPDCSSSNTFCPCSVSSDTCIICDMDETEVSCECPCRCRPEGCLPPQNSSLLRLDVCPEEPQRLNVPDPTEDWQAQMLSKLSLPPCFDTDCSRRRTKDTCFGVIGCAWCEVQQPGSQQWTSLAEPFCGDQTRCFGGVLGAMTPYEESKPNSRHRDTDDYFFRSTPSIGPIAGSIVGAFLFLGLSAYCIRNYNKCTGGCLPPGVSRSSCNESSLRVASFEEVSDENDIIGEGEEMREMGAHQNAVLVPDGDGEVISPYRMNPGYRRPQAVTDSDHGYSTMTPMGDLDSEVIPYTDSSTSRERLQRMQRMHPPSSLHSVTSGVSSRTSSPPPPHSRTNTASCAASSVGLIGGSTSTASVQQPSRHQEEVSLLDPETMLPKINKHQFVVAATVHMVDPQ